MGMIQIDMEMPDCCGLCPCFHFENPMYCRARTDVHQKITAPYRSPRPEWCPLQEAAYAVNEAPTVVFKEKEGWISVKDRLPERKWIDYLVATRILTDGTRGFNVAWLNDDNGKWSSNDSWICDGSEIVTHWMPLPEPPEEGSERDG